MVTHLIEKIDGNADKIIRLEEDGIEGADVVVVSYGITSRIAIRAIQERARQGLKVGFLRLITVWPFCEKRIRELAGQGQGHRRARDSTTARWSSRSSAAPPASARSSASTPAAAPCMTRRKSSTPSRRAQNERGHPPEYSLDDASPPRQNPMAEFLRMERMPHIWCPGCGIGSVVTSFAEAVKESGIDLDKIAVVSGIGCTGRVAGYVNFDSFHTTHGRAIPFATGLKLANPELKVVVFSGDGDLTGIGGNHFIHAARRNMDLVVICVNNFTYGMTGGQVTPTTPPTANASTTPYGNYEYPFNLPFLADAAGATYVARWTSLHARNITQSIDEALKHKGFSFIEVISPCTTLYLRRNRLGDGVDALEYYQEDADIKHGADTRKVDIDFQGKIVIGKFVERDKPTYLDAVTSTTPTWSATTTSSTARRRWRRRPRKKRARAPPSTGKPAETAKEAADVGDQIFRLRRPGHRPLRLDHRQGGFAL